MANQTFRRGFVPVDIPEDGTRLFTKDTASSEDLFINSPFTLSGGKATSVGAASGSTVKGSIIALFDSNGLPVCNLATTAAGTVIGTYKKDQRYRCCLDGTQYGGVADIGSRYQFTAESATVGTSTTDGDTYSEKMLDASDEHSADGPVIAQELTGVIKNTAGVIYCEVYCTIDPDNWPEG